MHFLIVLALSLIDNVRACSSNKCECQKGYKAEDYGYRTLCYKRYTGKKTYDDAQVGICDPNFQVGCGRSKI